MKKPINPIIIVSLIILVGIVFYSLSNRYYIDTSTRLVVDRLTGNVARPIVNTPDSTPEPASGEGSVTLERIQALRNSWTASDFETKAPTLNKGDFSKVVISGESLDDSNPYMYNITCTVKNNDSIPHKLTVKAIFYDKDKNPILTEESLNISVGSSDIESAVINAFNNVESISSYELKLIQSEDDGVMVE